MRLIHLIIEGANSNMEKSERESIQKRTQFNIIKDDPTRGEGGYGVGTISLENVTPVIIDPENQDVFIDMGALHGRSRVEQKVSFKAKKDELVQPQKYWIVWIALDRGEEGAFYSGAGACEIIVSKVTKEGSKKRLGHKSMPEHVNSLDKAIKRKFSLDKLDDISKLLLKNFLVDFNNEYWEGSPEELKKSL